MSAPNFGLWVPRVQEMLSWKWNVASCRVVGPCGEGPSWKVLVKMIGRAAPAASSGFTFEIPKPEGGVLSAGCACCSGHLALPAHRCFRRNRPCGAVLHRTDARTLLSD